MNIMIDLETLGTKPNSTILSVGAVAFNKDGIHDKYYANIDLEDSLHKGYDVDASTIYWWLKQSAEAGCILSCNLKPIREVLIDLQFFFKKNSPKEVWANSPSFDLVMLKNAFNKENLDIKWNFWDERDYRTFLNLTKQERVVPTVAHNALEDAIAQATTVMNYLNKGELNERY